MPSIPCRLCDANSSYVFTLAVLDKYQVDYFQCVRCGSLETESPYWLAEAYGDDVHPQDVTYLTRNIRVYKNVMFLLRVLGVSRKATILDYGGGLGFVPRLLRESGYNAFNSDTYTKSPFANCEWDNSAPSFVLAIEVFEHLPNPKVDMQAIFGSDPEYVYASTWRYQGQGPNWEYIAPSHGEHVFLYTDEAMRILAKSFGYEVLLPSQNEAFFYRAPISRAKREAVFQGLKGGLLRGAAKRLLIAGLDLAGK
jgi:hypothetical protein